MKIQFCFRCTAFGVSYYDMHVDGVTREVQHTGMVEDVPAIQLRYGHDGEDLDEAAKTAWRNYCLERRQHYLDWLASRPDCQQYAVALKPLAV